jgi:hypothetical protein
MSLVGVTFFACGGINKSKDEVKTEKETVYSCAYVINGETKKASSKEECLSLENEADQASSKDLVDDADSSDVSATATSCSYNINGVRTTGSSKQECDELKKLYGTSAFSEAIGSEATSCSYNVNGVLKTGSTKQECEELKQLMGL